MWSVKRWADFELATSILMYPQPHAIFVLLRTGDEFAIGLDNVLGALFDMQSVNVLPEVDLAPEDFLAETAFVVFLWSVTQSQMLLGRGRRIVDDVTGHTSDTAVRNVKEVLIWQIWRGEGRIARVKDLVVIVT